MVGVCLWRSRGEAGRGRRGGALGGAGLGAHTGPRPPRLALRLLPRSAHPRAGATAAAAAASFSSSSWALAALEVGSGRGGEAARPAGHRRGRQGSAWRRGSHTLERGQRPGARGAGERAPPTPWRAPPTPPARPPLPAARARLHTHLLPSAAAALRSGRSAAPRAPLTGRRGKPGAPRRDALGRLRGIPWALLLSAARFSPRPPHTPLTLARSSTRGTGARRDRS